MNEFLAYQDLGALKTQLSPRSFTIATYALCSFANFGSIAVMIGGIGSLVPVRRKDIARYGIRSLIGGALACEYDGHHSRHAYLIYLCFLEF